MDKKILLVPALALASVSCREENRPNIVIILADDMGYGDLGCQNPESKIPTPSLDRLASQGMRFTDAHSASTVSSPSRYSLLTGRYHWRGHLSTGIIFQWGDPAIEKGRPTIASILREEGYVTACIGKWHLGQEWPFLTGLGQADTSRKGWHPVSMNGTDPWGPDARPWQAEDFDWSRPVKEGPLTRGFDYYFGTGTINFPPYTWIENDRVTEVPVEMIDLNNDIPEEGQWECRPGPAAKDWDIRKVPLTLMARAVKWIDERKGENRPFFLYYPLPSPHAPIIPGQEFRGRTAAGGFGDYMYETDWCVGQILEALRRNGFEDNTIVIFTSDNGPEGYAYERIRNFDHYSMGDLRGLKRDLWEGGHRVPFIVKYPGRVSPGSVSDKYVCNTDIMATLAGLTGFTIPEGAGEDSYDQSSILLGNSDNIVRDHLIYHAPDNTFAIKKDNWVLVDAKTGELTPAPAWIKVKYASVSDSDSVLLYNLENDPEQIEDISAAEPERVKMLSELLGSVKDRK